MRSRIPSAEHPAKSVRGKDREKAKARDKGRGREKVRASDRVKVRARDKARVRVLGKAKAKGKVRARAKDREKVKAINPAVGADEAANRLVFPVHSRCEANPRSSMSSSRRNRCP